MSKIILYDSDEAAKFVTGLSGWVDSNGLFWGDNRDSENMARYSGCTDLRCSCGHLMKKHYTKCAICREREAIERYKKRAQKEWDESIPVYSETADEYFNDRSEVEDFLEQSDEGITAEDLRLLICEPVYLRPVEEDYWIDDLPDDAELPSEAVDALDALNNTLKAVGPVGYRPGKFAAKL